MSRQLFMGGGHEAAVPGAEKPDTKNGPPSKAGTPPSIASHKWPDKPKPTTTGKLEVTQII
jgi:hypothetical protein